jgi:hypothetical protein
LLATGGPAGLPFTLEGLPARLEVVQEAQPICRRVSELTAQAFEVGLASAGGHALSSKALLDAQDVLLKLVLGPGQLGNAPPERDRIRQLARCSIA